MFGGFSFSSSAEAAATSSFGSTSAAATSTNASTIIGDSGFQFVSPFASSSSSSASTSSSSWSLTPPPSSTFQFGSPSSFGNLASSSTTMDSFGAISQHTGESGGGALFASSSSASGATNSNGRGRVLMRSSRTKPLETKTVSSNTGVSHGTTSTPSFIFGAGEAFPPIPDGIRIRTFKALSSANDLKDIPIEIIKLICDQAIDQRLVLVSPSPEDYGDGIQMSASTMTPVHLWLSTPPEDEYEDEDEEAEEDHRDDNEEDNKHDDDSTSGVTRSDNDAIWYDWDIEPNVDRDRKLACRYHPIIGTYEHTIYLAGGQHPTGSIQRSHYYTNVLQLTPICNTQTNVRTTTSALRRLRISKTDSNDSDPNVTTLKTAEDHKVSEEDDDEDYDRLIWDDSIPLPCIHDHSCSSVVTPTLVYILCYDSKRRPRHSSLFVNK
jgi:hypothetical protein